MHAKQQHNPRAEVSGAFLLGMIDSLHKLQIFPPDSLPFSVQELSADAWYPYDHLIKLSQLIQEQVAGSENILFWAGVRFIHIWYWQGPGKHMIASGLDWVHCHKDGGGYKSVTRGAQIGWCRSRIIDEEAGFALVENVMPLAPSYLRGIYYGGFHLFNDMAYFNAEIDSVSDVPGFPYPCTVIKLVFKKRQPTISPSRHEDINSLERLMPPLSSVEAEDLLWRYRHQRNLLQLQEGYSHEMNEMAAQAFLKLHSAKDALAIANLQLSSEATTDALTGLHNRRYFNREIAGRLKAAISEQKTVCVVMIDIDHFKRFNDSYGHPAGDTAIIIVAECIKENLVGGSDFAARLGGEEFVIALVDTDEQRVAQLVSQIAKSLEERKIAHGHSEVSAYLTFSAGSAMGMGVRDIDALLQEADKALYRAKSMGRNRHIHAR